MLFAKKEEVFTIKDFLAGEHKKSNNRKTSLINFNNSFGFMGIDVTHKTFFSPSSFNAPYFLVFTVAGIALFSTFLEYRFRLNGRDHDADNIQSKTNLFFTISFYLFLYFGIIKTF